MSKHKIEGKDKLILTAILFAFGGLAIFILSSFKRSSTTSKLGSGESGTSQALLGNSSSPASTSADSSAPDMANWAVDPSTGLLISPNTGNLYDPNTGDIYDPNGQYLGNIDDDGTNGSSDAGQGGNDASNGGGGGSSSSGGGGSSSGGGSYPGTTTTPTVDNTVYPVTGIPVVLPAGYRDWRGFWAYSGQKVAPGNINGVSTASGNGLNAVPATVSNGLLALNTPTDGRILTAGSSSHGTNVHVVPANVNQNHLPTSTVPLVVISPAPTRTGVVHATTPGARLHAMGHKSRSVNGHLGLN